MKNFHNIKNKRLNKKLNYLISYDIKGTKRNSYYKKSRKEFYNTLERYGEIQKLRPRSTIKLRCKHNCKNSIKYSVSLLSKKLGIKIILEIK